MKKNLINRRFCTAPMMEYSDKHCRYFWRGLSQHALMYTEMVTTGALIHGQTERFLEFNQQEHPIALQLGGSNSGELAQCAKLAQQYGYDEVNLNVGCPSDRVQNNRIGACLMDDPKLVAQCIDAMQQACDIPVSIKHRIGIDNKESYEDLLEFVNTVAQTGCKTFIIHARIAILAGLSPKQNREIPPLNYAYVYAIKKAFPELEIIINGGIENHQQIDEHLKQVDGVMLGRAAYHTPAVLMQADSLYFDDAGTKQDKKDAIRRLYPYIKSHQEKGGHWHSIMRHTMGLFHGEAGGRLYRRYLSENIKADAPFEEIIEQALNQVLS